MSIDAVSDGEIVTIDGLKDFADLETLEQERLDEKIKNLKNRMVVDGNAHPFLLNRYVKENGESSVWDPIRAYVRNAYFLPLNNGYSYADALTASYTAKIMKTLRGEETELSNMEL
ncbi:hypothetical protein COB21_03960 [Candidatus Aerophobetes bacterium]|uniref:Uncharacterized protein n=1 Tax=Aerophobetes bacterium TaxID=2030807 RepID=A0A2A4X2C1_UNCAE|nr:MAG: hypothetical protein COB21_03960 [Candidatus Aerophobetes bacterium]